MKRVLRALAVAGISIGAVAAMPAWSQSTGPATGPTAEQWTFNNVTFSSGGSLTGYFTVNAVTHSLITWSITTSAGTATYYNGTSFGTTPVPGFTYNTSTSSSGTTNVILTDPIGQPLWFVAGMARNSGLPQLGITLTATADPNVVSVSTNSGENWANPTGANYLAQRGFATGYLQRTSLINPVPEPSTLLLTAVGLGIVGLALRRNRAAGRVAQALQAA